MISKTSATECFIYITLPGETSAVTAGRFVLGQAEKIIYDIKAQVEATWYETLRASGASEKDAETIRGAFVYPGFSL